MVAEAAGLLASGPEPGPRKPEWLRWELRRAHHLGRADAARHTGAVLARLGLATVCQEARCPNRGECFSRGEVTFLILGRRCTRGCGFCALSGGRRGDAPEADEPERLARAALELGLRHVVVTSPTRDDLPDGGADHYAAVVGVLRRRCPGASVELLVPDFKGSPAALEMVLSAGPHVLAHNVEMAPRLSSRLGGGAGYGRSLRLLRAAKELHPGIITKSGLMLGLGEREGEVLGVLDDLASAGCDLLTLGQYLAPSARHAPVARWVAPEEFEQWRRVALAAGLRAVAAGPLVRSSYRAKELLAGGSA